MNLYESIKNNHSRIQKKHLIKESHKRKLKESANYVYTNAESDDIDTIVSSLYNAVTDMDIEADVDMEEEPDYIQDNYEEYIDDKLESRYADLDDKTKEEIKDKVGRKLHKAGYIYNTKYESCKGKRRKRNLKESADEYYDMVKDVVSGKDVYVIFDGEYCKIRYDIAPQRPEDYDEGYVTGWDKGEDPEYDREQEAKYKRALEAYNDGEVFELVRVNKECEPTSYVEMTCYGTDELEEDLRFEKVKRVTPKTILESCKGKRGKKKLKEAELPEFCYSVLPSDETKVIAVKRNEEGYFPVDIDFPTKEDAKAFIDKENKILGVDEATRNAMEMGSMFGWHVPGANPDTWRKEKPANKLRESANAKKRFKKKLKESEIPSGPLGKVLKAVEDAGWGIEEEKDGNGKVNGYAFETWSPAGEDLWFNVACGTEGEKDEEERAQILIDGIVDYANIFDADEHAAEWAETRGQNGAPDSIQELLDDALAINEMYRSLADAVESVNLNESCKGKKKHSLKEGRWSGNIKSGAQLRKKLQELDEDASPEECKEVLDILKTCCEEAKALTDDEYYQNGFQSVIDDIECIYYDEELNSGNVDWELDGFYDWCDGAGLWVNLNESCKGRKSKKKKLKEADKEHPVLKLSNKWVEIDVPKGSISATPSIAREINSKSERKPRKIVKRIGKEMKESVYALEPEYGGRNSYYGKALVEVNNDGRTLYSYGTPIARIKDGNFELLCGEWALTNTTLRHLREFMQQEGLQPIVRKDLVKMINNRDNGRMTESAKGKVVADRLRESKK